MNAIVDMDSPPADLLDDYTSADWRAYRERAYAAGRQFVAAVEAALPAIHARRAESEAKGRVPDATVQAMIGTGLFRAFTPLQYGGLEMDPASFFEGSMKLAAADGAAAWIGGQLNVHSFEISLMSERMQSEFWADGPDTRASSSYAPIGGQQAVDGGYVLNGRWTFSSGVDHAQWVILGGGDRNFVVPIRDVVIDHDSWDVQGLKGTGSKAVTLTNVFVPAYRTHLLRDTYEDRNPGWAVNNRPLYHLSFIGLFNSTPPNTAIGLGTAGLDCFVEQSRVRRSRQGTGLAVSSNPFMHLKVADGMSRMTTVRERHLRNWRHAFDEACAGRTLPRLERMRMRFEAADSIATAYEVVADLWSIAGAAASATSNPLQHIFRDLMAARNHGSGAREAAAGMYVRTMLDEAPPPFSDFGTLAYYR